MVIKCETAQPGSNQKANPLNRRLYDPKGPSSAVKQTLQHMTLQGTRLWLRPCVNRRITPL